MTDPNPSPNEVSDAAILESTLWVRVDGNIILEFSQRPKKSEGFRLAYLKEILLVNRVEMWVGFENVFGAGVRHQRINGGLREIRAQFVNQWGGQDCIPDPGHGYHQNLH